MHQGIEEIINLLKERRLKEALIQINSIASQTSDWQLRSEVESMQTSYDLMLQYTLKGMKDPNKKELYDKMTRTAYELAERANIMYQSGFSYGIYYETLRKNRQGSQHSYAEFQLQLESYTEDMATAPLLYQNPTQREGELRNIRQRHEKALNEMFEKVWVSIAWNENEATELHAFLNSLLIQSNDLSLLVSAVTMSLLKVFDIRKYLFLLAAYRHPEIMVNQRAIIGIALVSYYYDFRIMLYPEARAQLSLLTDDLSFIKNLYAIQIQLLLSRETQKIDKKMREEIIPEMMKNPLLRNPKIGYDETEEEEDRNPEWEEWIDKSGISNKIRELGEMQMAGADVYMSTFSLLKNYPFFRQLSNWFYPFDKQYSSIATLTTKDNGEESTIMNILLDSDVFCDSDKYSFCFTMIELPEAQRKMMQSQLSGQNEFSQEQKEQLKEYSQQKVNTESISRQYIQNLYRFFKLWIRHSEEHDIFGDELDLWNCNCLKKAFQESPVLNNLADYLFKNNYMKEAFDLYNDLIKQDKSKAEIWQKAGYALQKMNRYEEAISFYTQADIILPDHIWTNRHLAQCYRKQANYPKTLEYYQKVEAAQPDNLNLLLQIGQCLVGLHRYNEALAYFFKVEYLEKNPTNARRAIGWCSFVTGKYEEARKYYDLLLQAPKPKMQDWMNAGHVYQSLGHTEKAVEYYKKAQQQCSSHNEFIALYLEDKDSLLAQGFTEEDIYILMDELI